MTYPKTMHIQAYRLRQRGWTYERIGKSLGVDQTTVATWLDPERRGVELRRKRRWRRAHANGRCKRHGRPTYGEGSDCRECRRERGEVRMALASRWWCEGMSGEEIAKRLGLSHEGLYRLVDRGRQEGVPFPYRKRLTDPRHDQIHMSEIAA